MPTDAFSRAIADHFRGEQTAPLRMRDGEETREHDVEDAYFGEFDPQHPIGGFLDAHLSGPLLDLGAGVGRDALYFQRQFETVAVEVNEHLVEVMRERGVRDARLGDMFALRETFDRDRFGSLLSFGTQLGLTASVSGLRELLADMAHVTHPSGTAVVDSYDPSHDAASEMIGYRADPALGLAHRVMTFEYEESVDDILLFRLFGPDRIREATIGTPWTVTAVNRSEAGDSPHYCASLEKH